MRANKHLLLWSSVMMLLIVIVAIVQEHFFQDWRRIQTTIRDSLSSADADRFEIKLRQIVAPTVGAMDRCVSCHVGMAPGETGIAGDRLYGKHVDVFHDPEEFGCTICHAGQGRATATTDAHGEVPHWPQPMIPKQYSYAGCGTCHAFERIPSYERLLAGRVIVQQLNCHACHVLEGTPPPRSDGTLAGPDLTLAGIRGFATDWPERHPALAAISAEDRSLVDGFLASSVGAAALVEAQATFNGAGCRGCHVVGAMGGDLGPPLTRVGLKAPGLIPFDRVAGPRTMASFFKEHFRDPARVVAGSRMPKQDLTEPQIERLTLYMFSLRRSDLPTGLWPKDRLRIERFGASEFVDDGPSIFDALCTGCHGADGAGGKPNPNSVRGDFPPLDQLATRYQLYDRDDVAAVVAELREHGALAADRPLDVASWSVTLAQDGMVRTLISKGNRSGTADPAGPAPIDMPAWGSTLNQRQLTAVIIHLLSISAVDEDDDEDDE